MTLLQLLDGFPIIKVYQISFGKFLQTQDIAVKSIAYDSRLVKLGSVFVAIRGLKTDGHKFIQDAIEKGAKAVVMEDDAALSDSFFLHTGVMKVVVHNTRRALAVMSSRFYDEPSKKLHMIGITGTNGKTTTTYLITSMLEAAGEKVGLIGTIEYKLGEETIPATYTTPESLELNNLLHTMVKKDLQSVVMEVSSHALSLDRVFGFDFDAAVFTNLTQDHLDFHGTMEEYFKAKKILFDSLSSNATAVINLDDAFGSRIHDSCRAKTITYSFQSPADVKAENIQLSMDGITFDVVYQGKHDTLSSSLVGRFNVYNILGAYACGIGLGIETEKLKSAIRNVKSVRGRFERIISPRSWTAIIDYAHTPDALENCLRALHDVFPSPRTNKIITVFGCGGNRDRGKRPLMSRIASELSDVTIVTSDNPRHENPEAIIDEIMVGIKPGAHVIRIADRREAIHQGLSLAKKGDVVLIAGKGHEDYQVIGDKKIHFDDREIVEEFIGKQ